MNSGYCANPFDWSSPFCHQSSPSVEIKPIFNFCERSEDIVTSLFDWKKHGFGAISEDRKIKSSIGTPSPIGSPTSSTDDNYWSWDFNDAENRAVGYNRPTPSYLAVGTYWPRPTRQQYKNILTPNYDTFFKSSEDITTTDQSSSQVISKAPSRVPSKSSQKSGQQTKRKRRFPVSRKAKSRPKYISDPDNKFSI